MGRICSVPGCSSGSNADVTRRRKEGIRLCSLFTIPKKNNVLQKWSKALGHNLAETDVLCELHFKNEFLVTEDITKLPDGTVHRIPRKKYKLADNTLPFPIGETRPEEVRRIDRIQEPEQLKSQNHQKNSDGVDNSIPRSVSTENSQNIAGTNLKGSEKQEAPTNTQKDSLNSSKNMVRMILDDFSTDDEQEDEPNEVSSADIETQTENDYVENEEEWTDRAGPLDHISASHEQEDPITIHDIIEELSRDWLPERWTWMRNPKEESSIIFIQIDSYTMETRMQLILHKDLSMTACTIDGKVTVQLDEWVSSVEAIRYILKEHGKKIVCGGIKQREESRSVECCGFVNSYEYRKFVLTPRCQSCRHLRQRLKSTSKRRKTAAKSRYFRLRHANRLKQRACRRLKDKVLDIRKKMEPLRYELNKLRKEKMIALASDYENLAEIVG